MDDPDLPAAAGMVGRERAVAELGALLDAARAGHGRAALVRGEAGMGKTTLVEALAARARPAGFVTAWGWCPAGQRLPYLPWRPVFRHLGLADPGRAGGDRSGGEELGRQRLFATVLDKLEEAARDHPLLLVMDDLHWADPPTLTLLRAVAEAVPRWPVLLVGTARDNPLDIADEVAASLRDLPPAVLRLTLDGLAAAEVGQLVTAVAGHRPSAEIVAQVHRRTGGNPFFAAEFARTLADPQTGAQQAGGQAVPPGVREVLERRFARLDPQVRRALRVAAVVGEPVDLGLVAAGLDSAEPAVVGLLDEGIRARLLQPAVGEAPRFTHALFAEVLAAELSTAERVALHECVARALEDRGDAQPAVLAHHWSHGHGVPARQRAATWSLAEARLARRGYGFEQAVAAYRRGLTAPGEDGLALLLELAETERLAGDPAAARRSYLTAAHRARELRRPDDLAAAALGLGGGLAGFEVGMRDEEQVGLLREVLAALPPGDGELRAAVLARLSVALTELVVDAERIALAGDAVAMAQRVGDPAVRVAALAAYCDAIAGPAHVAERLAAAIQMRQLAESTGDPIGVLLARRLAVVALAERGQFTAADAEAAAYARTAGRLGVPHYRWLPLVWRARTALLRGDLDGALLDAAQVGELGALAGSVNAGYMAAVVRWHAWRLEGTLAEHAPQLRAAFDDIADLPNSYGAMAECALATGDHAEARRLLRAARDLGLSAMPRDSEWLAGVWCLGEVAVRLADRDLAQEAYEAMAPFGPVFAVEGLAAAVPGVTHHMLGRLAAFRGDGAAARRHLDDALAAHRDTASPVLVAATEAVLGELDGRRPPAAPAAEPRAAATGGQFRRAGRLWQVAYRGESAIVPHSKGMADIAALLRTPGREVHVLDLVDATGTVRAVARDAGPELDATARAAYRRRLAELADDLAAAERDGDLGRAERLRTEHEFLTAELAGALGLGGRARTAADPVERARKAVAMRIATALRAVEAVHPSLARHLRLAVITGRFCSYRPEQPVNWNT